MSHSVLGWKISLLTFKGGRDGITEEGFLCWDVHGAPGVNEKLMLQFISKMNLQYNISANKHETKDLEMKREICMSPLFKY